MTLNYSTQSEGAKLVDFSSELDGCHACHVLDPHLADIWLSEEGLPQWLCISLDGIKDKRDLVIRTIGWHCWHPYTTNPKEVTIHVSSDGSKFKIWDTFHARLIKGTQLFCCAPISSSIYPFIALEVTQTFGGPQTYMNRVYMYAEEIPTSPPPLAPFSATSSPLAESIHDSHYQRSSPARSQYHRSQSHSPASRYLHQAGSGGVHPVAGRHPTIPQDPRIPYRSDDSEDIRDNCAIAHKLDSALVLQMQGGDASFFSGEEGEREGEKGQGDSGLENPLAKLEQALNERTSDAAKANDREKGEQSATPLCPPSSEQRMSHLEDRLTQLLSTVESFSMARENESTAAAAFVINTDGGLRRSEGEHRESRFTRAMESIEGLVTNVLERVERRHTLAVQLAVGTGAAGGGGRKGQASLAAATVLSSDPRPDPPEVPALDLAELRAEYLRLRDLAISAEPAREPAPVPFPVSSTSPRVFAALDESETTMLLPDDPEFAQIVARLHEVVLQRAYKVVQLGMLMQMHCAPRHIGARMWLPRGVTESWSKRPGPPSKRSSIPVYLRQTHSAMLKKTAFITNRTKEGKLKGQGATSTLIKAKFS